MPHAIIDLSIVVIAAVVLGAIAWLVWCIWQDIRRSRQNTPVRRATLDAIIRRDDRQGWTDAPHWRLRGDR